MPAIAPVLAQPQVLVQARQVLWTGAVWVIGADCIGGFFQTGEAVGIGSHEPGDLGDAFRAHLRDDIDQHQRRRIEPARSRDHRGNSAQRGPDQREGPRSQCCHRGQIVCAGFEAVIGIRRPVAVTMAAQVIVDREVSGAGQLPLTLVPRMPGLPPAMPQHHGRRAAPPRDVGGNLDPGGHGNTNGLAVHRPTWPGPARRVKREFNRAIKC